MSKMFLAAAGSGKTTFLIQMTSDKSKKYLYTTFTDENVEVARAMIMNEYGCIPSNVTVLPWFSFLLEHGVRPFQGAGGFNEVRFNGVDLNAEGRHRAAKPKLQYFSNSSNLIYAAKLPDLALYCDDCSQGAVFDRLRRLFDVVLIDEAQDMAGYDYEFIERLIRCGLDVVLCGDERQTTFRTNSGTKYRGKTLEQFLLKNLSDECLVDKITLNGTHRCVEPIIRFANRLYPNLPQTQSLFSPCENRHSGVWIVPSSIAEDYAEKFHPVVLCYDKDVKTVDSPIILNFGRAKGRTFDDVLIYPTKDVLKWLIDDTKDLSPQTRSKFYVAITRARYSVGIVVPDKGINCLNDLYQIWETSSFIKQELLF